MHHIQVLKLLKQHAMDDKKLQHNLNDIEPNSPNTTSLRYESRWWGDVSLVTTGCFVVECGVNVVVSHIVSSSTLLEKTRSVAKFWGMFLVVEICDVSVDSSYVVVSTVVVKVVASVVAEVVGKVLAGSVVGSAVVATTDVGWVFDSSPSTTSRPFGTGSVASSTDVGDVTSSYSASASSKFSTLISSFNDSVVSSTYPSAAVEFWIGADWVVVIGGNNSRHCRAAMADWKAAL